MGDPRSMTRRERGQLGAAARNSVDSYIKSINAAVIAKELTPEQAKRIRAILESYERTVKC